MSNNHYPSLELCNKLTEIGFMRTEKYYNPKRKSIEYFKGGLLDNGEYWCPSVMEMLDVIPTPGWDTPKIVKNYIGWYVAFEGEHHEIIWAGGNKGQCDNLPNALAEMILWLHENNYISFSK